MLCFACVQLQHRGRLLGRWRGHWQLIWRRHFLRNHSKHKLRKRINLNNIACFTFATSKEQPMQQQGLCLLSWHITSRKLHSFDTCLILQPLSSNSNILSFTNSGQLQKSPVWARFTDPATLYVVAVLYHFKCRFLAAVACGIFKAMQHALNIHQLCTEVSVQYRLSVYLLIDAGFSYLTEASLCCMTLQIITCCSRCTAWFRIILCSYVMPPSSAQLCLCCMKWCLKLNA